MPSISQFVIALIVWLALANIAGAQPAACLEPEGVRLNTPGSDDLLKDEYGFGASVAVEGNVVVVGFPGRNISGTAQSQGAILIYEHIAGVWTELNELQLVPPTETNELVRFGTSVSISGTRIAVGTADVDGLSSTGANAGITIYEQSGGSWANTPTITTIPHPCPAGIECQDAAWEFGWSLDLDGNRLVVGAPAFEDTSNPDPDEGRIFIYEFSGSSWVKIDELENPLP